MAWDPVSLAGEISPFASAAVGAYGDNVLSVARDEPSDPAASLGRRMLQRVFGVQHEQDPLPDPLRDLVAAPADEDSLAAMRLAVRRKLTDDPALMAEVGSMMVGGQRIIQQVVQAGRDAYVAGRDQTIVNHRRSDA